MPSLASQHPNQIFTATFEPFGRCTIIHLCYIQLHSHLTKIYFVNQLCFYYLCITFWILFLDFFAHTHTHPNLTYVSQMLQIYPSYNPEKYLKQHILGTWTPTPHHIKRQKRIVLTLNTYAQNQVVDIKEKEIILRCFTVRCGSHNL